MKPTKLKRILFFLIFDALIFLASIYFAFLLRFSDEIPTIFYKGLILSALILTFSKIFLFWIFGIYRVPWRFFGLYEARKIFLIHIIASLILLFVFFVIHDFFDPFPRSVILIDFAISFVLVGSLRIVKRMFLYSTKDKNNEPCVIYGATTKSKHILNGIAEGHINYYPVAIIDGRDELIGTNLENFVVQNRNEIPKIVKEFDIKTAIIAAKLEPQRLKNLYDEFIKSGVKNVKIFTLLEDESSKISDVSIEDLLARKPKDLDSAVVEKFIKDKIVLVTGAGGSIGSEICLQCLKFGAKSLIMVDHSEYNLYKIDQMTKQDKRNILSLLNIVYTDKLEEIFAKFHPEIIIHAAAYKHVPICEINPQIAVLNNIIGTKNVVDLSKKYNAQKVVIISTDKAVRPTNVMGATKRVCEIYSLNSNQNSKTQIVAVRFGNVLGSSGSVIPKFKEQIANNEPLSVTDPNITRYFMLISEACQLVLQAASIANGGELFVLDMGEPVKIVDLAKKMLQLSNKEELGINFVGLRPGEKLYEELLIDENDKKTKFSSIFVTHSQSYDLDLLNRQISELLKTDDIKSYLKKIVPEYKEYK